MNYTLKVVQITWETEDSVTLSFKQPGLKKIKYLAGQYLTLIFRINGRRYIRPYSFSSCPEVDQYLEITVKRVPRGIVSNHIIDTVQIGDSIEAMSPMGDFIFYDHIGLKTVYLWGVGSGITPLISIAKFVLKNYSHIKVVLLYGNRNNESTIFLNQIDELVLQNPDQLTVRHFHTRNVISAGDDNRIEGRINEERAKEILTQDNDYLLSSHYICGPIGLKESVKQALGSVGVPAEFIYAEDFELVKDPKDFEEIATQRIRLNFDNQEFELEVIKGKSILESALDADIELPYSCQTGNCSTCKGRLLNGEVKMIGLDKDRDDLNAGEYLLCCTHPISNNVHIEI